MLELIHILFYKLKSSLKLTLDTSIQGIIKNIGSIVLYAGFTIAAFLFTRSVIGYLLNEAHIGLFLLHRFLSMVLFVFFLAVNIGNIIVSYSTLYKSAEVMFLFTKPVSFLNIFIVKFLDNFFYSSTTLFLIGFAVIAGYGSYFAMPLSFYFLILFLAFIPFMLIAASSGVIILFALMKMVKSVGLLPVIIGLVFGYIGSIILYFEVSNPKKLVNDIMNYYPNIDQYFSGFDPYLLRFLPNYWISEFLYWSVNTNLEKSLNFLMLLIVISTILFIIMLLIASRYYRNSWLELYRLNLFKMENKLNRNLFNSKGSLFKPQENALIKKELILFLREPTQWIHFSIMLILMMIFGMSMIHFNIDSYQIFLKSTTHVIVYMFTAFLIASMALRFVYPIIALEADNFWKIRSAPVSVGKIFYLKFTLAFTVILLIGVLLTVVTNWSLRSEKLLFQLYIISIVFISLVLVSINISAGSFFSSFKENNPIRIASTQGASLTFLISLLFLFFAIVLIFYTVYNYFNFQNMNGSLSLKHIYSAIIVLGIFSIFISIISFIIGIRSLNRDL